MFLNITILQKQTISQQAHTLCITSPTITLISSVISRSMTIGTTKRGQFSFIFVESILAHFLIQDSFLYRSHLNMPVVFLSSNIDIMESLNLLKIGNLIILIICRLIKHLLIQLILLKHRTNSMGKGNGLLLEVAIQEHYQPGLDTSIRI